MIYFILCVVLLIALFYKFCVIKAPANYPPGPRIIIPVLGITLDETYRLLVGQDEIEKHKEYKKRYVLFSDTYVRYWMYIINVYMFWKKISLYVL